MKRYHSPMDDGRWPLIGGLVTALVTICVPTLLLLPSPWNLVGAVLGLFLVVTVFGSCAVADWLRRGPQTPPDRPC